MAWMVAAGWLTCRGRMECRSRASLRRIIIIIIIHDE